MFSGVTTALVTPFTDDGAVDYDSLARLVDRQIADGIQGILACGSTGEAATLSHDEHIAIFAFVKKQAAGRVPVMAGTGSNNTREAVALTQAAAKAEVDAALVIAPYYNKPTQAGLVGHFSAIAECSDLPVFLYDIPGRTGIKLAHETVERVAEYTNIVGLKDATGDVDNTAELVRRLGDEFILLSGDDGLTVPFMSVGARGVISVASHLVPGTIRDMCEHFAAGRNDEARAIHLKLLPLIRGLFCESNPTPVKYALNKLGWIDSDHVRAPLVNIETESERLLDQLLVDYHLG